MSVLPEEQSVIRSFFMNAEKDASDAFPLAL
jgi:hypothetical protein